MKDVREILKKRPLLFDGGMGTYYKAKPGQECEQANLLDPDGILTVHRAYLEAGADAIKTNTFGLPRMAAAQNPMWEAMADEGWKLAAQAAAKTGAAVFADLGPAPDTEALPAAQIYTALAERFAALGAKNFLFETLSSDAGVAEAAKKIKETVPDAFVLVSFAVLPDGYTREGRHCAELVRSMTACGAVDAVGLNCVSAPGAMRTLVQQLGRTELPLSVMPNAGYPVVTRTRVQYQGRPEYFAREMVGLAAEGVRILGGCCGTTPAHIAALRTTLDALPGQLPVAAAAPVPTAAKPEVETDDAFLRKLNAGKKVIAIELDSPKDADLTGYLDGARRLQAAGADLLTIADCPIARARMDSSLVACRVHRELVQTSGDGVVGVDDGVVLVLQDVGHLSSLDLIDGNIQRVLLDVLCGCGQACISLQLKEAVLLQQGQGACLVGGVVGHSHLHLVQLSHSRRSCGRSSAGSSRRCGGRRTAACGQGSCSSCSSGNFQKITTSNHSFVPSLFAYYNVQRPARHSSVLRVFDGCMKKAPVLDLEPTLRQGREHNILPWYHLGLPHPCGHSLNAAAALLLTAGRCNGRIPLQT